MIPYDLVAQQAISSPSEKDAHPIPCRHRLHALDRLAVERLCATGRQRPARLVGHLGNAGVEDRRGAGRDRPHRGGQDPADRAVPQGPGQSAAGNGQCRIRGHLSAPGRARAGRDPGHSRGAGAGCEARADGWPRCGGRRPTAGAGGSLAAGAGGPERDRDASRKPRDPSGGHGAAPGGDRAAPRRDHAATRGGISAGPGRSGR
jgi:hypothetical protein